MPDTFDSGYFIGAMAGDGYTSIANQVGIAANTLEIKNKVESIIQAYTGKTFKTYESIHDFKGYACRSLNHRLHDTPLCLFLKETIGSGAFNKIVPELFSIPFSSGIISGMLDTDGTLSKNNKKNAKLSYQVSFTSRSKNLLLGVQKHLEFFDVINSLYTYERFDKPVYMLNVRKGGNSILKDLLVLFHPRKKERLLIL